MKVVQKAALLLCALLFFTISAFSGYAVGYGYLSARHAANTYNQYGGMLAFVEFARNVPESSQEYRRFYYLYGTALWAETKILTEKNTQDSYVRRIHGTALLPYARTSLEELRKDPHTLSLLKKGYVSLLATEVMEIADARRCQAEEVENALLKLGEHTYAQNTYVFEKKLAKLLDKKDIEALWQEALHAEEMSTDRPLTIGTCVSTNEQRQEILSLGGKKVLFLNPAGQAVPTITLQPPRTALSWTMDDATWNAARKEIRTKARARWAQRFAENNP